MSRDSGTLSLIPGEQSTTAASGGGCSGLVLQFIGIARTLGIPAERGCRSDRVKTLVPRGDLVAMALGLSPLSGSQTNGTHQGCRWGERAEPRGSTAGGQETHGQPVEEATATETPGRRTGEAARSGSETALE